MYDPAARRLISLLALASCLTLSLALGAVQVVNDLYTYVEPRSGKPAPLISEEVYQFIQRHKEQLNSAIVYDRDYSYDYFGFKTMEV
jgi:hypothetical protein